MASKGRVGWLLAAAGLGYLGYRWLKPTPAADLTGQVVLITGGSRGLGLRLAHAFTEQGCRVAICARKPRELERARDQLAEAGADVYAHVCDVSDRAAVERLVQAVTNHFGRIDLLVNNASIIQVAPLENMTLEDFEHAMAINFRGALHTVLAVYPQMKQRRYGRIVNIDSIGGRVSVPHLLPYNCAKFALRGLSEGLRAELSRYGILVTTVLPGLMRTGSPLNAFFKGHAREEFTWFTLGDTLPLSSIAVDHAARAIVEATRHGTGEVTLSWQAQLLGLFHDLMPNTTLDVLSWANRMLPRPSQDTTSVARGMDVELPEELRGLAGRLEEQARGTNQFGAR